MGRVECWTVESPLSWPKIYCKWAELAQEMQTHEALLERHRRNENHKHHSHNDSQNESIASKAELINDERLLKPLQTAISKYQRMHVEGIECDEGPWIDEEQTVSGTLDLAITKVQT